MRVAIQDFGGGYEMEVIKVLSKAGFEANILSSSDILKCLRNSFSTLKIDETGYEKNARLIYDCFIISSKDVDVVNKILDYSMSQYPGAIRGPKIIMLTSLLSWNGKSYRVPVSSSLSEFTSRVPSSRDTEVYRIENKFHSCASITGMQMVMVGVGLVYGGHGYDFHNLFRSLWDSAANSTTVVFSMSDGKNFIPSIHYHDLALIISHVVSNRPSSIFVPATDFAAHPLDVVVKNLASATKQKIRCTNNEEALDALLNAKEDVRCNCPHRLWNVDLRFAESHRLNLPFEYPQGLIDSIGDVWREFVGECTNRPCTVLIAGPPSSLKTTIAKCLANKLGIKYVDRLGSIKYVIEAAASPFSTSVDVEDEASATAANDVTQTLDVSRMNPNQSLVIELRRAVAVQMSQSGDKKKKGVDENTLDIGTVEFTDALLDSLPQDLLRQATKNFLLEDATCGRCGYVLDTWTTITETSHIYDITNTRPDLQDERIGQTSALRRMNSGLTLGEDDSQVSGSIIGSPRSKVGSAEPTLDKLPSLIVELKCTSAAALDRYLAMLGLDAGATKVPKDQQAAMKDLEAKFEAYNHLLVNIPDSSDSVPEGSEETKGTEKPHTDVGKSHPVVIELQSIGYNVHRVDVSGLNGRNPDGSVATPTTRDEAADRMASILYDIYCDDNGSLNWLLELKARDSDAAAAGTEKSEGFDDREGISSGKVQSMNEEPLTDVVEGVGVVVNAVSQNEHAHHDDGEVIPPRNAVSEINEKIKDIPPEAKAKLVAKCNEMQNYLVENVIPHVAEALIRINREKVEDPVFFMADFLLQRGTEVQEKETTDVLNRYLQALAEAEAMEEAAAAELLAISNNVSDA